MSKWKYIINVTSFYHDNMLSIEEKGKKMAKAIKHLPLDKIEMCCGDDLEDLAERFEHLNGNEEVTPIEEFDYQMDELYDMADRYGIWIETIKR